MLVVYFTSELRAKYSINPAASNKRFYVRVTVLLWNLCLKWNRRPSLSLSRHLSSPETATRMANVKASNSNTHESIQVSRFLRMYRSLFPPTQIREQ